ncbi:MAG: sigma-70 family RNA polymerase sigma factor [Nodularia sp. (in: cyanobacteria)]|nr:sigma-70 family RNA polymerase sigma factor [Nodularia sp. (in: cyanobacteria)]
MSKTVCEKYDPDRGSFLTWFKVCLRHQYRDELRAAKRDRSRRKSVWQNDQAELDPLDQVASPVDATLLLDTWESFVQWIKDDPDNLLKTCHIRNNPTVNCQLIAYLKVVNGKEEKDIATEFGLSRGTISAHWTRKCKSLIRQWLEKNQRLFGEDNYER